MFLSKNQVYSPNSFVDNNHICYIAAQFFPTARAFIRYFEVMWYLTMKLFPAKITERENLQNLWRQRVRVHCYPRMLTNDRRYSEVSWILSLKISSYVTNDLKTDPSGNSQFFPPESQYFRRHIEILGKQQQLFPSGPFIKCLMLADNTSDLLFKDLERFLCSRLRKTIIYVYR